MGVFNKSLKHFRPSKNLEEKIKHLDKDLEKTKVVIDDNDLSSLYEETKNTSSVSNWREEFIEKNNINDSEIEFDFLKENKSTIRKVSSQRQQQNEEIIKLRDEILKSISEDLVVNLPEVSRKIDRFNYAYSTLVEGLLNDPEGTKNTDPLTPLNQNFVTVDELNNHYKLFIHRIQEQLATLGGGGETKLQYLDDIVGIATNASAYDNKFLKYTDSIGKFEFVEVNTSYSPVSGISTVSEGLTGTPNLQVGIVTASSYNGDGINLTGIVTSISAGTGITVTSSTGSIVIAATNGAVSGGGTWATTSAGIHTTKNVGVGTTNPITTLQVERYGVVTGFGTFNASSGVEYQIDTFNISTSDFKTAEYTLHIQNASGIQAQKILVMQDGVTAYSQEYGVMYEPSLLVSVGATVSTGSCNMNITPESGVSGITTYRFVRQSMI